MASPLNRDVIGSAIEDLDTPALLLDGAASQRNLRRMAEFFRGRKSRLRPHFKNHKCPELARRQQEAGSLVGFTCAKLGEAEVLAEHGFDDLLIANQVVGRRKLGRLAELAGKIRVMVAVDDFEQAKTISEAAFAAGVTVGVLVEVDIGMGRCGVAPGEPAVELVEKLVALPGLQFRGVQAYEGHTVYTNDVARRTETTRQSMAKAVETRRMLQQRGIAVELISGGSSSTYQITGQIDGIDEVQAGTYATMDWRYAQLSPEFEIALSVLTRVISKRPGVAVLDVGIKGAGAEFGTPRIKGLPEAEVPSFLSEEHSVVKNAPDAWRVGDAVHLVPSHACSTCNLHRTMVVHEAGRVVDLWPIEASGRLA
jgi:D-serine deaminase-like pyridoxal phosphate-dependent protein